MQMKSSNRAKLIAGAVLAGIFAFGNSARASILLDLRAVAVNNNGGGFVATADPKSVSLASGTNVVRYQVVAQISNSDSDHTNDGFTQFNGGLKSVEAVGTGTQGNYASMVVDPGMATGVSQGGVPTDIGDGNPDLELGDIDANAGSATNWVIVNGTSTLGPKFGTGAGAGTTDFVLGTVDWTETSAGSADSMSIFVRPRTSGTASQKQMVKWTQDGTAFAVPVNDANITFGSPVTVATPEPASMALLSVVGLGLLGRRRRA